MQARRDAATHSTARSTAARRGPSGSGRPRRLAKGAGAAHRALSMPSWWMPLSWAKALAPTTACSGSSAALGLVRTTARGRTCGGAGRGWPANGGSTTGCGELGPPQGGPALCPARTLCGCTIMPLYSATILEAAERCTGWMPVRRPPISRSLRRGGPGGRGGGGEHGSEVFDVRRFERRALSTSTV